MIDAFATSGEDALGGMRAGAEGSDAAALRQAAHRLKGAAANLHLSTLAELAARIESASADPISCALDLADLEARFRSAVEWLRRWASDPSARQVALKR